MAGSQWYFVKGGKQLGPIPSSGLRRLVRSKEIGPSHLVWKEGLDDWIQAKRVKGLFAPPKRKSKRKKARESGAVRKPVRDSSNSDQFLAELGAVVREMESLPVVDPGEGDQKGADSSAVIDLESIRRFVPTTKEKGKRKPPLKRNAEDESVASIDTLMEQRRQKLEGKEAGIVTRGFAALLDGIILGVITILIIVPYLLVLAGAFPDVFQPWLKGEQLPLLWQMMICIPLDLVTIGYCSLTVSSSMRGTLGKYLLGLMITDRYGNQLAFSTAFVRQVLKRVPVTVVYWLFCIHPLLAFIPISWAFCSLFGHFLVFVTPQKQALHDMLAGTLVLEKS